MFYYYLSFVDPSIITSNSFCFPVKIGQACSMVDSIKWDHITCSSILAIISLSPNSFSHFFLSYLTTEKSIMAYCMILMVYMRFLLKTLLRCWDAVFWLGWLILRAGFCPLSTFWLSISFLQLLCYNTGLVIISCTTSCAPSQPELLLREIPQLSQILQKTTKSSNSSNSLNSAILSFTSL